MDVSKLSYRLATREEKLNYHGINSLHGLFSTYDGQVIYLENLRRYADGLGGPKYELVAASGQHFVLNTGEVFHSILADDWRDVLDEIKGISHIDRCRCF